MPARKLLITLVASGLLLFGIGAAGATANDDPAPPATACSNQQGEQGTVEQDTADDVAATANEVADEADNEQADDESGDEQGDHEDADEPDEDGQCGDQGDDD